MSNLYLDIETIPCQQAGVKDALAVDILPPGNYSKPETIAKWEAESKPALVDEAYLKTGFDGGLGEVLCIGWAIDGEPSQSRIRKLDESERDFLKASLVAIGNDIGKHKSGDYTRQVTWIGHNILNFDIRFLWQRCVVLGVKPPFPIPIDAKPWGDEVFDTMIAWSGMRNWVKLDKLAGFLGGGKMADMDGSKVYQAALDGEYDRIAEYCRLDVEAVRLAHLRMTFREMPPSAAGLPF